MVDSLESSNPRCREGWCEYLSDSHVGQKYSVAGRSELTFRYLPEDRKYDKTAFDDTTDGRRGTQGVMCGMDPIEDIRIAPEDGGGKLRTPRRVCNRTLLVETLVPKKCYK